MLAGEWANEREWNGLNAENREIESTVSVKMSPKRTINSEHYVYRQAKCQCAFTQFVAILWSRGNLLKGRRLENNLFHSAQNYIPLVEVYPFAMRNVVAVSSTSAIRWWHRWWRRMRTYSVHKCVFGIPKADNIAQWQRMGTNRQKRAGGNSK